MFLDNLSTAVLRLCDEYDLTYESASERCDISSRYFGDIARGKTAPTISTLEKLCLGFDRTPNELLIPLTLRLDLSFRLPMSVTQIRCFREPQGMSFYPICPRCHLTMEREYQCYCDRCGQQLAWDDFHNAALVFSAE